ncbi:MAG: hypothetical protein HQK81_10985 [Desulfovibrionaceae bacterium]|nr:hypothetical protein [Desulfovibrionaceae bacterium]MBF0514566.1 hypothetical protein [Desulfovibrionaceae bacterium]
MQTEMKRVVTCFLMSNYQTIIGRTGVDKGKPYVSDPAILHLQKNEQGQFYPVIVPLNQFGTFTPGERHRLPNPALIVFRYPASPELAVAYENGIAQIVAQEVQGNPIPEEIRARPEGLAAPEAILPDSGLAPGEIGFDPANQAAPEAELPENPESAPAPAEVAD